VANCVISDSEASDSGSKVPIDGALNVSVPQFMTQRVQDVHSLSSRDTSRLVRTVILESVWRRYATRNRLGS
jgi:hypothetical protein